MMPAAQQTRSQGQMTASMQAVKLPSSKRVLRIAIVQGGRVVEERSLTERDKIVSVGPSEKDSFCVVDPAIGASLKLFEVARAGCRVNVPAGATGRIVTETSAIEIAQSSPARTVKDVLRGRLVLGDVSILFSYEIAPDVKPQPAILPPTRREMDWNVTIIAAFSFLFHFGVLGSLYSDWQDPRVDDRLTVESLLETLRDTPALDPEEHPEEAADAASTAKADATASAAPAASASPAEGARSKQPTTAGPRGKLPQASRAALANELAAMDLQMNTVLNTRGPSTDRVLDSSDVDFKRMDEMARSASRTTTRANDLGFGSDNTGDIHGTKSLATSGDPDAGSHTTDSGRAKDTKGPMVPGPTLPYPEIKGTTGDLPDANKVVGRLQGSFRRCYQNGIDRENEAMEGTLKITMKVGPNGEVTSATASAVTGSLSGSVVACMVSRASGAQFQPPKNGAGAVLVVPVAMRKQK